MSFIKKNYFKIVSWLYAAICRMGGGDFAFRVQAVLMSVPHIEFERKRKKRANGWVDKRYIKLKQYKNIHEGKRCFIVCNGPSLTVDDVNKLKNEYTFGMNAICKMFDKTDWRPTYYTIIDQGVQNMLRDDPGFSSIKNRFIGSNMLKQMDILETDIIFPADFLYYLKHDRPKDFSEDIYSVVYIGASVMFCAMQIAVYMGFKEIYLLGCDQDYSGEKKHFDGGEYKLTATIKNVHEKMLVTREVEKKYCDAHGIKVYNATRGGKLEIFERVDFDSLFDNQ